MWWTESSPRLSLKGSSLGATVVRNATKVSLVFLNNYTPKAVHDPSTHALTYTPLVQTHTHLHGWSAWIGGRPVQSHCVLLFRLVSVSLRTDRPSAMSNNSRAACWHKAGTSGQLLTLAGFATQGPPVTWNSRLLRETGTFVPLPTV